LFDHTSTLRFIETLFGAEVPNLSAWRRAAVGDLTSALNFVKPDPSIPSLPSAATATSQVLSECATLLTGTTPYPVPNPQSMPAQEAGMAPKPSGMC
jgi:phospholipase C